MDTRKLVAALFSLSLLAFNGSLKAAEPDPKKPDDPSTVSSPAAQPATTPTAAKPHAIKDPIAEANTAYRSRIRDLLNNQNFDALEKEAGDLRAKKVLLDDGEWKIVIFYQALEASGSDTDATWQLRDTIHQAWIAAKPTSITARVAYADYFTNFAWRARGDGYPSTVPPDGSNKFTDRLLSARKILDGAKSLPERDPVFYLVAFRLALGQDWPRDKFDALATEANAFEPKFWLFDTQRAYALQTRWYGKDGDWEAYADQASQRPRGLGAEGYARIVMYFAGEHGNIFKETKISWPKTREGLLQMQKEYPRSLLVANFTALLASLGQDRPLAKQAFDSLGNNYLPVVWKKPDRFTQLRDWAESTD